MKIVGVVLVRNEDRFISSVLESIHEGCDSILVMDHSSRDRTLEKAKDFAQKSRKLMIRTIHNARESHALLQPWIGTDTWIFAVDGDEIYDPVRTPELMNQLRKGQWKDYFRVKGHSFHVASLGPPLKGYLAPPARPVVKLFNFSLLEEWKGAYHRLHGGKPRFREGSSGEILNLRDWYDFHQSPLRCLHFPFMRRTSKADKENGRLNISDRVAAGKKKKILWKIKSFVGVPVKSPGKDKNYRFGEEVALSCEDLGGFSHFEYLLNE
jgi:glycosyltransferase involved in cell wall biosynthesis